MKTLTEVCLETVANLKLLEAKLDLLTSGLVSFEYNAQRWPEGQVAGRLRALGEAIRAEAWRLLNEHGGQGCVCLTMGKNGINHIIWVKEKELVIDNEYFKSQGTTVLLANEMLQAIGDLVKELEKGNWVPVVAWLNSHTIYTEKHEPLC